LSYLAIKNKKGCLPHDCYTFYPIYSIKNQTPDFVPKNKTLKISNTEKRRRVSMALLFNLEKTLRITE